MKSVSFDHVSTGEHYLGIRKLEEILETVRQKRVLVVGDYFLDKYLFIDGLKDERSLETGLTAYQVVEKRLYPGAAGNVANNFAQLGFGEVIGLGILGDDAEGIELRRVLDEAGIDTSCFLVTQDRVSPTYIKPVRRGEDGDRELNRIDIQNWKACSRSLEQEFVKCLVSLMREVDAVVVVDQVSADGMGIITAEVRSILSKIGRTFPTLPILVDSRANIGKFTNVILKPNQQEAVLTCGMLDVVSCGIKLSKVSNKPVFLTMGEQGQVVFDVGNRVTIVPAYPTADKIDIVGAGDSASAGIVSALCAGANLAEAAFMGNLVASVTVEKIGKPGTATPEELRKKHLQVGDIKSSRILDMRTINLMEESQ